MNELVLLITLFLALCFLRVPIAFAMTGASLVTIVQLGLDPVQIPSQMMRGLNLFPLLAVPLYILAGEIMNRSDLTDRLMGLARAIVGGVRGSLAQINILTSMLLGGVSGSSTADAAGIGSVMIPAMTKAGYTRSFAVVITAMSSTMGNIIPPSIFMIVYGALSGVSIGALFLGGAIPGLLIGLSQMGMTAWLARKHDFPSEPRMNPGERFTAFRRSALAVGIPFVVVGGIATGIMSPTEAAAALVIYAMIVSIFIYRSLSVRQLPSVLKNAAYQASLPLFTIASASIFGWLVGYLRGPDYIVQLITAWTDSPLLIVLLLIGFLLIMGTFLSEIATIIIFMPVIQRLGDLAQMEPVHLGVLVVMTLCLGLITPPYGICLLIAAQIGEIPLAKALKDAMGFFVLFILVIALLLFVPELVLLLPELLLGR